MSSVKQFGSVALILFAFGAFGQKAEKVYQRAEALFYQEMLEQALGEYELVRELQPGYRDTEYKAEICSLLTAHREKPLDKLVSFKESFGKTDRFYNYWLGRVYVSAYMFEEAMQAFQVFLNKNDVKSGKITDEARKFIALADQKMQFLDNTSDYEIHQLEAPINTVNAELTPAFFSEKDELLFASNRSAKGAGEDFSIYHAIKEGDRWADITEITILGDFARENANVEVVSEDGKLFIFDAEEGDLFYSETRNGKWVRPVEFDTKLKAAHIQSHFFINEHEDRIIFATLADGKNRDDLDLYQTFKDPESGKWSRPAPFNLTINSELDEDSPYLTPDEKTLYFASNGHGSFGGMDIFKSELNPKTLEWTEPINMGFPINSPDDEMNFKMNDDGQGGYFSSNRLHTTGDFDIYSFWEIEKIRIEGRVFDLAINQAIEDGMIRFTPSQYTDEHFRSKLSAKGKYQTEIIADETYLVEIIKDGETLFTDEFEIHETGGLSTTYLKDFMFSSGTSATGGIGRIEDADRQVVQEQIKARAQKEQRRQPTTGTTPTRKDPKPRTVVSENTKRQPGKNTAQNAKVTSIRDLPTNYSMGRKAVLRNVYFDFGTSGLGVGSDRVLTELLNVLQSNPRLRVEIGGHSDNVGSTSTNLWLSQKRAEAVRNWLISKGVNDSRLVAKGYGESQPLASNDDEEDGRELNRRIEIFVIE